MRIEFSENAVEALKEIYNFLYSKNERAATVIRNSILNEIKRLLVFPQMASIEPILKEESEMFRSLVIEPYYKVVYYVDRETIIVVDIWDCRQDPEKLRKRTTKKRNN